MNKMYRYLRGGIAAAAGMMILALAGVFYPVKVFDVQLTALLQRVLVGFSLATGILLAGLLLLTFLFGRLEIDFDRILDLEIFAEFKDVLHYLREQAQSAQAGIEFRAGGKNAFFRIRRHIFHQYPASAPARYPLHQQ